MASADEKLAWLGDEEFKMRVLIACEFSGVVRDAFLARGHDAWSCDIYPSRVGGNHIQRDVLGVIGGWNTDKTEESWGPSKREEHQWELMIAHPPCTHLCVSGASHFKKVGKRLAQIGALQFVRDLLNARIPRICLENPVGIISTKVRKPDQIIQPCHFGDPERKTTCLWLKGLPLLEPTRVVEPVLVMAGNGKTYGRWVGKTRGLDEAKRGRARSVTFKGIAQAMVEQWGCLHSTDDS